MTFVKGHRTIFKIIAIILPFTVLFMIELLLRAFDYGYDTRLFIENPHDGTVVTNTRISKRFFPGEKDARVGIYQTFKKEKSLNSFRIFVVGGSSAYGFPFTPRASFARMLQDRLTDTFRGKDIEVINLSVTAINSFAFLTFADEMISMGPDAILIYAGHNEYYGAMGVGSSQHAGSNRYAKKLIICLKQFKIVQLCFNLSESVKNRVAKPPRERDKGFMARMARDQKITFGSDIYFEGIVQFRDNMNELLSKFNDREIPVFLSTLVSNEKDQKPFISCLNDDSDSTTFFDNFRIGEKAYLEEDFEAFSGYFSACQKIDSTYAMNHFLMGKLCCKRKDYRQAQKYFVNSKELDALRFRAPEAINNEIVQLSRRFENVHLVDALEEFREKSDNGIPGNEVFMDHLHPNIYGNFLIADAFYASILDAKVLGVPDDTVLFKDAWKNLPVTAVDSIFGMYTTFVGKEQWPFYEKANYQPGTTSYAERLTIKMFRNEINLDMAMDSLYLYYSRQNDVENALKVVKSLALEYPHETKYRVQAARLYELLLNFDQSVLYYKKAFRKNQTIDVARKIVFDLLQLDRPEEAVYYLKYLGKNQPGDQMANMLLRKTQEVTGLKKQLQANPGSEQAILGLADYYLFIRNLTEVKRYLDAAIANFPDDPGTQKLRISYEKLASATRIPGEP